MNINALSEALTVVEHESVTIQASLNHDSDESIIDLDESEITSTNSGVHQLHFCDLPIEIRTIVYRHLLVKKSAVLVSFSSFRGEEELSQNGYGRLQQGLSSGLAVGGRGVTNIVLVSRQINREATDVLYSENYFRTFNTRGFAARFIHQPQYGVGKINAARMKQTSINLHEPILAQSDTIICELLDLICNDLIGLQCLLLETRFNGTLLGPSAKTIQCIKRDQRNILYITARVTERHPILKKATWLVHGNGDRNSSTQADALRNHTCVRLTPVEMLQLMHPAIVEDLVGNNASMKVVDLDCAKIQGMTWKGLLLASDSIFQIPDHT